MLQEIYNLAKSEGSTFVIIKNGEKIHNSQGIGVKPIMEVISQHPEFLQDATVLDKIIGKAAAILLIKYGVREVYGEIMSQLATEILKAHGVEFSYGKLVKNIQNRAGDDLCPLEKSVIVTDDIEKGVENIKHTIAQLMKK